MLPQPLLRFPLFLPAPQDYERNQVLPSLLAPLYQQVTIPDKGQLPDQRLYLPKSTRKLRSFTCLSILPI